MEIKINLSNSEHKDLLSYCNLNDLLISSVVKDSFTTGFNIERYGLLNAGVETKEKEVIKEVIKYVEVPVVEEKEVVKIEYVEVEKIVEVPVDRIIEVIKEIPSPPTEIKVIEYVDREVIKEVIKEVFVSNNDNIYEKPEPEIREVIIEKIVEVIKEVPFEVVKEIVIERETEGNLKPKLEALQNTVQKLKQDNIEKDKKIKEYEKTIEEIQKFQQDKKAAFLRGSNLNDTLYK
jgi:hypothetical protein